eukprot:CAMPEP_0172208410 /NCGR_PEP_ID=MMETSP1050-20130122/34448_1 /TAXON_ID=233186 /ORGANISM="Cryptomonas curvata, Strain CCAP979/52" /LENGTH=649 /DNA_ID=CAMNT_0012887981 /DNA_START=237 /DNA_END=2183 /DNA_ORIENTATION=-
MDERFNVENHAAQSAAAQKNIAYSCDDVELAQAECFVASNWRSGWVGALMGAVFDDLGLKEENIEAMTKANFSVDTDPKNQNGVYFGGGSSFTRCIMELTLDHVDICLGAFWETPQRRSLVSFTTAMLVDQMKLMTIPDPRVASSSKGYPSSFPFNRLSNIFQPFDLSVWALTILMLVLGGLSIYFVEYQFESEKKKVDSAISSIDGSVDSTCPERLTMMGALKSIYSGFIAFTRNEQQHAPRSWAGKTVLFGLHFVIYISAASYTATLTSFLVGTDSVAQVISDFSVVQKWNSTVVGWDTKICMLESMSGLVNIRDEQKHKMDDYGPMLEQLKSKKCGAAVVGKGEQLTYIRSENVDFWVCANSSDPRGMGTCVNGGPQRHVRLSECECKLAGLSPIECPDDCPDYLKYCDIMMAQEQSTFQVSLNFAVPLRMDLEEHVSSAILQRRLDGTINSLWQSELVEQNPDRCAAVKNSQEQSAISVGEFSGLFIYAGGLMLFGVILHSIHLTSIIDKDTKFSRRSEIEEAKQVSLEKSGVDCIGKVEQGKGSQRLSCSFQKKADCLPNLGMADKTRREEAASLLQKLQDISSIVGKIEAQRSAGKARCVAEPTTQAPRLVLPSSSPTPASLNVLETAGGALADGAASLLDQW